MSEQIIKPELQDALTTMLTKTTETVGSVKDFALSEMPDVVQQLMTYKTYTYLGLSIVGLLLLALFIVMTYVGYKHRNNHLGDVTEFIIYATIFISPIVGAFMFFINIFELIKISVAPKVWLIEYAANLIK